MYTMLWAFVQLRKAPEMIGSRPRSWGSQGMCRPVESCKDPKSDWATKRMYADERARRPQACKVWRGNERATVGRASILVRHKGGATCLACTLAERDVQRRSHRIARPTCVLVLQVGPLNGSGDVCARQRRADGSPEPRR